MSHGKWGSSFLVQTLPIYHHNFANSEGASQDEHIPSEKYDGMADLNPFKQGFVEPVESQLGTVTPAGRYQPTQLRQVNSWYIKVEGRSPLEAHRGGVAV